VPRERTSAEAIAHAFIDAFNRRDADGLVALAHPGIEWRPSRLAGVGEVYHGHDGLRRWLEGLRVSRVQHQARVREVRAFDESRFAVISEVLLEGEPVTPSAMVARLSDAGTIIDARAYLSDEQLLERLGLVPEWSDDARKTAKRVLPFG
jgi:hypothetical protein